MKTAMKKVFSLMLVAVLLVGVMPFQAFAADGSVPYYQIISPSEDNKSLSQATGLTAGQTYNLTDFTIPEGYEFDYVTKNGNRTEFPIIPSNGEVYYLLCNPVTHTHSWGDWQVTTDATCTTAGSKTRTCSQDATHTDTVEIPAKDHSWGEWTVTTTATCSATGIETRICDNDSAHSETRNVEKDLTVHNYVNGKCTDCDICQTCNQVVCRPCTTCGAELDEYGYHMCTGCYLDEVDCACSQTSTPEDSKGKVKLILDYNYKGAKDTKMNVELDALLRDVVASIPAPTRDKYFFKYWTTDEAGTEIIDEDCDARATRDGVVIYAQWADNITNVTKGEYTVSVDLNYDDEMGEPMEGIAKGTKMEDVLDYIEEPTRNGFKFAGWYWDARCRNDVEDDDKVFEDCTIYAKWERRRNTNEIMLKIYLNGNTKSVAKIVDLYEYSRDGKISLSEVKDAVEDYYTAKDSDGLSYDGLFDADDWSDYVRNHKNNRGSKYIEVNEDSDTIVYVMVSNATTRSSSSSSSTADSTNPKTGDMIFAPAIVLGASVTALAALFFLNKKQAVK